MPAKLPKHDSDLAALDEVRAVYADLAKRPVQRDCIRRTECCQFKLTGVMPMVTKGEVGLMVKAPTSSLSLSIGTATAVRMRPSMLPGLLDAVRFNFNYQRRDLGRNDCPEESRAGVRRLEEKTLGANDEQQQVPESAPTDVADQPARIATDPGAGQRPDRAHHDALHGRGRQAV